ncbi:MAG: hypothetical protein U0326_05430 [Polyangiales bacterium]
MVIAQARSSFASTGASERKTGSVKNCPVAFLRLSGAALQAMARLTRSSALPRVTTGRAGGRLVSIGGGGLRSGSTRRRMTSTRAFRYAPL